MLGRNRREVQKTRETLATSGSLLTGDIGGPKKVTVEAPVSGIRALKPSWTMSRKGGRDRPTSTWTHKRSRKAGGQKGMVRDGRTAKPPPPFIMGKCRGSNHHTKRAAGRMEPLHQDTRDRGEENKEPGGIGGELRGKGVKTMPHRHRGGTAQGEGNRSTATKVSGGRIKKVRRRTL